MESAAEFCSESCLSRIFLVKVVLPACTSKTIQPSSTHQTIAHSSLTNTPAMPIPYTPVSIVHSILNVTHHTLPPLHSTLTPVTSHHIKVTTLKTHRPNTHRRNSDPLPLPFQLRKRSHYLSYARAAQWMPQGDGAAAGIDFGEVERKGLGAVDALSFCQQSPSDHITSQRKPNIPYSQTPH